MNKTSTKYTKAFEYLVHGFSVIPCGEDKRPLLHSWKEFQTRQATEEEVTQWWEKWPEANIGLVTGRISGISVIDVDTHKGGDPSPFPKTYTVKTGNGGLQLYYKYEEGLSISANAYEKYPNVDIRNDGGYVIAPPSVIIPKVEGADGKYEIIENIDFAPFPSEMFPATRKRRVKDLISVSTGKRNDSIASLIGKQLFNTPQELWQTDAWAIIQAINKTYNPPLAEDELIRTFNSIARKEKERRESVMLSPMEISRTEIIAIRLRKNKSNLPYKDMTNAVFALASSEKYAKTIRFDQFKKIIEIKERPKDEKDVLEIQEYLQNEIGLSSISKNIVEDAIQLHAFNNEYDSALEYLNSLKWDKTPRVDEWLIKTFKIEDSEYVRAVGSNWLRALVKRVVRPGTKFDHVLVVEGDQGIKKTFSFATLGKDWHVETIVEAQNKDFLMQFNGKAIVEFSEGDTLTRSEVKTLKAIITRTHDKYRAPYGRHDEEHPRRCVFCMTTNDDTYLKDDTGNRRWWPVRIPKGETADTEWLKTNRDQLFAEAMSRIEEPTWIVPEDVAKAEQDKRRFVDDIEDKIVEWFLDTSDSERENGVNVYDFYEWLHRDFPDKGPKIINRVEQLRVGSIFRTALALEKQVKWVGGRTVKKFFPTENTPKIVQKDAFDGF